MNTESLKIESVTADMLEDPPESILKIVKGKAGELFTHYLFYQNTPKGVVCSCTACGNYGLYIGETFKHKEFYPCRKCGAELIVYCSGYGKISLEKSEIGLAVCENLGGLLCVRCFSIKRRFVDMGEPAKFIQAFDFEQNYVFLFSKKKSKRFGEKSFYSYKDGKWIYKLEKMSRVEPLPSWINMHDTCWADAPIINKEALKDTELRYSAAELLDYINPFIRYIKLWKKQPKLEYMMRAGFKAIVGDLICNKGNTDHFDWSSNNLLKILGICKTDIEFCKNMTAGELKAYKEIISSDGRSQAQEIFTELKGCMYYAGEIRKNTGLKYGQILKYIKKQKNDHGKYLLTSYGLNIWFDYIRMSLDLFGEIEQLRPKSIQHSHDNLVERKAFLASQKENEMIRQRADDLEELCMEFGGLIMKVPQSGNEIISEGLALQHCVGSYCKYHATGSTNILFIRKKEKPDIPYFTIEVSPQLEILQCHGYKNERESGRVKPEEIIEFEKAYAEFLSNFKKRKGNKKWTA